MSLILVKFEHTSMMFSNLCGHQASSEHPERVCLQWRIDVENMKGKEVVADEEKGKESVSPLDDDVVGDPPTASGGTMDTTMSQCQPTLARYFTKHFPIVLISN